MIGLKYNLISDPMPSIWNLTNSVGPKAVNRSDDVKLVQFFLKKIYQSQLPTDELMVTGVIDPATVTWIRNFQLEQRDQGVSVYADGTVDPARRNSRWASISHTEYTIVLLNERYKEMFGQVKLGLVPPDARNQAASDANPMTFPAFP